MDIDYGSDYSAEVIVFTICNFFFCLTFTFDLVMRFCAFKNKCDAIRDRWFQVDFALTFILILTSFSTGGPFSFSTLPVQWVSIARFFRLAPILRATHHFPRLQMLLQAMGASMKSAASASVILGVLIYGLSLAMRICLHNVPAEDVQEYFGSVGVCMWTLLMDATLLCDPKIPLTILYVADDYRSYICFCLFFICVLFSAVTLMNMLIGMMCEVVSKTTSKKKEDHAIQALKQSVLVQLQKFDRNGNNMISFDELDHVLSDDATLKIFDQFGIDMDYVEQFANMLFDTPTGETSIHKLMDLMLAARKDLPVSLKHLSESMYYSTWSLTTILRESENRLVAFMKETLESHAGAKHILEE